MPHRRMCMHFHTLCDPTQNIWRRVLKDVNSSFAWMPILGTLDAFLKRFSHIQEKRKSLSRCLDCQQIHQCGKFCLRPRLHYNEVPTDLQCREAWLKNISRQGHCKRMKWEPCDRSFVCSLILQKTITGRTSSWGYCFCPQYRPC